MARISEREAAVEAVMLMAIRDGYRGARAGIADRLSRPGPMRAGERPLRRGPRFAARDTDPLKALRETPLG